MSLMIRAATPDDATELARLTSQLGYPVSPAAIRQRLESIGRSSNDCLLVADLGGGVLAGWVHGFLGQLLESEYRVEIGGLIVDERRRRHGLGRELVGRLELWAAERGARELTVRCRVEREEAHRFYETLAFRPTKTQRVFRKPLTGG